MSSNGSVFLNLFLVTVNLAILQVSGIANIHWFIVLLPMAYIAEAAICMVVKYIAGGFFESYRMRRRRRKNFSKN